MNRTRCILAKSLWFNGGGRIKHINSRKGSKSEHESNDLWGQGRRDFTPNGEFEKLSGNENT